MPYVFVFYPDPASASVTLAPDGGGAYPSGPHTDPQGRQGQVCYVPDTVPNGHGATLKLAAPGYIPEEMRGFLMLDEDTETARIEVDDYHLKGTDDPTPPPSGPPNPLDIINRVFAETSPQLWTHEGCGKFTEDCCRALHNEHSAAWGHIDKEPGQNQYNGHALDAIMLAMTAAGTQAGVYDIIFSSVSAEAKPVFNYAHPPNLEDWVYPEGSETRGVTVLVSLNLPRRSKC